MTKGIMTIESIHFQNTDFFNDLTTAINNLRSQNPKLINLDYFTSREAEGVIKTIQKYTNIKIKLVNVYEGACTFVPFINNNHPLFTNELKQLLVDYDIDGEDDIIKASIKLGKKELKGSVDLKAGKVDGIFKDFVCELGISRKDFLHNEDFTDAEIAAVILHEIGHLFTFMEFSNRFTSTNEALNLMMKCVDNNLPPNVKEIVFKNVNGDKLTEAEYLSALDTNDKKTLSVIVLGAEVRSCMSQLGFSLYDYTSSEYLADQYATRLGAGSDLVSASKKLTKLWGMDLLLTYSIWMLFIALFTGPFLPFIILISIISTVFNKNNKNLYDDDYSRYTRIRIQNTQRIKNPELSKEEKLFYIKQNESIENILSEMNENRGVLGTITYWLRPGYRKELDFEILQKSLERLSGNKLFDKAAKLSTL